MKRTRIFLLLLPYLCLGSCSVSGAYGDVNGEIADEATDYSEVMVEERATNLINRANAGETVYLFHAYSACSHCETVRPIMVGALQEFNLQISLLYRRDADSFDYASYQSDVNLLESTYPSNEDNTKGFLASYPRLYRIQGSVCQVLEFGSALDSIHSLSNFLSGSANLNGLTHFRTYLKAASFAKEHKCPLYLYDETDPSSFDFFFNEVRKLGSKASKPLAILDYNFMTKDQKAEALSGFSLDSYTPTLSFRSSTYDIKSQAVAASSLITSYF